MPRHTGPPQGSPPPRGRRLRAILLLATLAVGASGATVVAVRLARQPLPCGQGSPCAAADAGSVSPGPRVRVYSDPSLGLNGPTGAAYAAGRLWITNFSGNSVSEFGWRSAADPAVHAGPAYKFSEPSAIAAGKRRLWIANVLANSVTELNAADGSVVRTISHVAAPRALAVFGGRLWVAKAGRAPLSEFSVKTGRLVKKIYSDKIHGPDALAVSNGMLWVANGNSGQVTALNAATGAWRATLRGGRFGLQPVAEVASRTRLWVASQATKTITEISTTSLRVIRRIAGPRYRLNGPLAMALDRGALWVANAYGNSVTEIDARTGRLIRVLAGPRYRFDHPAGLVAHHGRIWVTNSDNASVTELRLRGRGDRAAVIHPGLSRR